MLSDIFGLTLNPLFLTKIGLVILIALFFIFVFVVLNQVKTMNNIVTEVKSSGIIMAIAILNLFAALSLFIAALVIL